MDLTKSPTRILWEDFQHNKEYSGPYAAITMVIWRTGTIAHASHGIARQLLLAIYRACNHGWVKIVIGSDLSPKVDLGRRICLPHGGRGLFIANNTKIGDDTTIHQQVTIGVDLGIDGAPTIGARVFIGAKATVIGDVSIGPDATIGAHSLVINDVPASCLAVGVPARVIDKSKSSDSADQSKD